ncbi:MAG: system potassium uptake protein [Miltoncostaeaceae bacterium]|nr:system potassium uptake protein [Miltoncostaeaceae bacterium]
MADPAQDQNSAAAGHGGSAAAGPAARAALILAALGIVFGDIGTSPIYAMHAVFTASGGPAADQGSVYGVISLVFWAITIIVSIKYVLLIMRVDNQGEGGIMALIALLQTSAARSRMAAGALVMLGVFGAALFLGDGMITPAISVLSAVEGLEIAAPSVDQLVIPITLVLLTLLFAIQRYGTGAVGRLFGPIMAVWFTVLALAGLRGVADRPEILRALSPSYGAAFIVNHGGVAFVALASVVLAVTGAEALYADMGHFGRRPISRAWFFLVFPALTLNYLGQGALILGTPDAIRNPFFLLIPHWGRLPMVLLATAATIIASQAVISGAFSVSRQAVQLGFLPRLTIRHTSGQQIGQVYVPAINWTIFAAVVGLVVGFGSSAALASAYGIAVTGTLAIDTTLFFFVVHALLRKPLGLAVAGAAVFLVVDLTFLSANLTKVVHGGWFPLAIAGGVYVLMTTWRRGREIVTRKRTETEGRLRDFVREVNAARPPIPRVPGCAVFLNANRQTTPLALRANVDHNHVLHQDVVIILVEILRVPHVSAADRIVIDHVVFLRDDITHVTARYGFLDEPNVPDALRLAVAKGLESEIDVDGTSYFLSRISLQPTREPGMARWRKKLFVGLARNSADPVQYFGLPAGRTVVMGSQIEF